VFLLAGAAIAMQIGPDLFIPGPPGEYDFVLDEQSTSNSLLAILWIPPAFMIVAIFVIASEYSVQKWTPPGHIIDEKWTPAQNEEARFIKQKHKDNRETWRRDHPNDSDGPPSSYNDKFKTEREAYRERHAVKPGPEVLAI
jgi:hypothetical protein